MAGNIQALIRYRAIDGCLQRRHQQWTWEKLSEACGNKLRYFLGDDIDNPSRRTIFMDIQRLKEGILDDKAPIAFDHQRNTYYYTDPKFSIYRIPLRREDLDELEHALVILRQFSGFRHMQGIESIITRLDVSMHQESRAERSIIEFDHPLDAPGQQWLDGIYRHIYQKEVLAVTYHPFDFEEPYTHPVSPYLLKEYNKRWFLVGYNHEQERIEKLALDRIMGIDVSDHPFHRDASFDEQLYFRDIIGVTIPDEEKVEKVLIRVSSGQAPYLDTKPLHGSQELLEKTETYCLFSLHLIPNYELESQLLAMGERVEVLEPPSLRLRLKSRVEALWELYSTSD